MQHCARQPTNGAGDAEAPQHSPVDVLTNHGEAQRRPDEMRNGDNGDRQLGADPGGQQRRQNAADAEARDRGNGARDDSREREQKLVMVHNESSPGNDGIKDDSPYAATCQPGWQ